MRRMKFVTATAATAVLSLAVLAGTSGATVAAPSDAQSTDVTVAAPSVVFKPK